MSRAVFQILSLFAILAWAAVLPAEVTRPKTDLRLPKPEGKDAGSGKDKDKEEKDGDTDAGDEEQPRPEMRQPGEDEHEAMHDRLEAEGRKNLKEISRLMDKVRNDLAKKQTGSPTQSDEREVTKKIQDLIEKLQNGCKSCSSSSSSEEQQQSQKKSGKKKDQSGSKRSENEKQSVKQDQKPTSAKDKEPKGGGKVENDRREIGTPPPSGAASLQEKGEQLARWGVLPRSEERRVGKECRSRWSPYH